MLLFQWLVEILCLIECCCTSRLRYLLSFPSKKYKNTIALQSRGCLRAATSHSPKLSYRVWLLLEFILPDSVTQTTREEVLPTEWSFIEHGQITFWLEWTLSITTSTAPVTWALFECVELFFLCVIISRKCTKRWQNTNRDRTQL